MTLFTCSKLTLLDPFSHLKVSGFVLSFIYIYICTHSGYSLLSPLTEAQPALQALQCLIHKHCTPQRISQWGHGLPRKECVRVSHTHWCTGSPWGFGGGQHICNIFLFMWYEDSLHIKCKLSAWAPWKFARWCKLVQAGSSSHYR